MRWHSKAPRYGEFRARAASTILMRHVEREGERLLKAAELGAVDDRDVDRRQRARRPPGGRGSPRSSPRLPSETMRGSQSAFGLSRSTAPSGPTVAFIVSWTHWTCSIRALLKSATVDRSRSRACRFAHLASNTVSMTSSRIRA